MKKNWQKIILLIAVACIAGFGFQSCDKEQKQDLQKNVRIAVSVGAAGAIEVREEVKAYCRAELMKPESCEKAKPVLDRLVTASGKVDKFLKEHPKLTPADRDELLGLVDDVIKELDALEAEGIIEFKDPENRRKFLLALAIGRSSVRIARVALKEVPAEALASPSPSPSPAE